MASLSQLRTDVGSYLNRQDYLVPFAGWVLAVETELAETLRHRCQIVSAIQNIDAAYITMPASFATMESIRDADTGVLLTLKDAWSGDWSDDSGWRACNSPQPCSAYRLLSDCIEFMPHPVIPDDTTGWTPQRVMMAWYSKPVPLLDDDDTNPILEQLYAVYLWGLIRQGALWALDEARAAQADAVYQQAVTRANLWSQQSTYSGAPYREELGEAF